MKVKILIPIFNDWKSVEKLVHNIDIEVGEISGDFSVIIINDASTQVQPKNFLNIKNLSSVKLINMKKNRGHGRCNAAGLKYIHENEDFDYVIPMDGDGEDRPEEIKLFIEKIKITPQLPIVGKRVKRSENFLFKFCYQIHKIFTFIFTGKLMNFGHFTCISKKIVEKMVKEKATWNCYSASLVKISNSRDSIPSIREKRYFDLSKMSYLNLIVHSFSIISVFKITVLIRSLIIFIFYILLIKSKLSIVNFIPIILIILFLISIFSLSKRENMDEYNSCLENILNIEIIEK